MTAGGTLIQTSWFFSYPLVIGLPGAEPAVSLSAAAHTLDGASEPGSATQREPHGLQHAQLLARLGRGHPSKGWSMAELHLSLLQTLA